MNLTTAENCPHFSNFKVPNALDFTNLHKDECQLCFNNQVNFINFIFKRVNLLTLLILERFLRDKYLSRLLHLILFNSKYQPLKLTPVKNQSQTSAEY